MFTIHIEEPQLHDMQSLNRTAANLPILPFKESEGPHHCSGMEMNLFQLCEEKISRIVLWNLSRCLGSVSKLLQSDTLPLAFKQYLLFNHLVSVLCSDRYCGKP